MNNKFKYTEINNFNKHKYLKSKLESILDSRSRKLISSLFMNLHMLYMYMTLLYAFSTLYNTIKSHSHLCGRLKRRQNMCNAASMSRWYDGFCMYTRMSALPTFWQAMKLVSYTITQGDYGDLINQTFRQKWRMVLWSCSYDNLLVSRPIT